MGRKSTKSTHECLNCKKECIGSNYYLSDSIFFKELKRIPYCKTCIDEFYNYLLEKYKNEDCPFPERKAIKRICMAFDVYYDDSLFSSAVKQFEEKNNASLISYYLRTSRLTQYKDKTYDDTILHDEKESISNGINIFNKNIEDRRVDEKTINFFGTGFSDDDYEFLQKEYEDWTARHECKTKAQEEVFKQICFTQLELLKATRAKQDTKDLTATFLKQLEAAKLQPKQNSGDTTADNQTFGTLIDKWENTRPIPEVDEELRDVDKIARYVDIFYRGHLAKMMGLKNGLSNLYSKFMKEYTVEKPEYDVEEDSEVLFDAIFGNTSTMSDE